MKTSESNKVMILGKNCSLQFGKYPNNTIVIQCYYRGNPFCVATVNWEANFQGEGYRKKHTFPIVVIKNYSENEGIYSDLIKAEVITAGFYLSGSNGTVQLGILTEKWQKIAKEQLRKIDGIGH